MERCERKIPTSKSVEQKAQGIHGHREQFYKKLIISKFIEVEVIQWLDHVEWVYGDMMSKIVLQEGKLEKSSTNVEVVIVDLKKKI